MTDQVRVSGLRETVRDLKRLGVEVSDLKSAFKKIGNIVVADASRRAPHLTGRLAASIRASNTQNKSVVRAGGASIPYAGVIHYGGYNHIKPHPFLTDAVDAKQREAINVMEQELNKLIRSLDLN